MSHTFLKVIKSFENIQTDFILNEKILAEQIKHTVDDDHIVDKLPLTTQQFDLMWLKDQTFGSRTRGSNQWAA